MALPALRTRFAGILFLAFALLAALVPGRAGSPQATEGGEDEKLLKAAGLPTDGPGLLKFFRDRTPSAQDRVRLAALVRQLGNRSFAVREKATRALTAAGERALEFLQATLRDPEEEEVRRRAAQCIRAIEQIPHAARAAAAARLLALRRPEGAADALLGYLPAADWQVVSENLLEPLTAVGLKGDAKHAAPVPAIVAALADGEPVRRAAAAHVLGHAAAEHRRPLADLLADKSLLVRSEAASALVQTRDVRGIPVLVGLIGEGPAALAWRAEELLGRVAGEQSPSPVPGAPDNADARKKWHAAWEGWWKANETKLDLARIKWEEALLGLTVICEVGDRGGQILECDRSGKLLWSIGVNHPNDVQRLRSGRVLVAEHGASRVTERDRRGTIVWERKLTSNPVCAERVRNGNTLIGTYHEILEVNPEGKTILSYKHTGGMIYCACKLGNGHVLFIDSTAKVVELDMAGKQVLSFTVKQYPNGAAYWASVEPQRGGRYLIALGGAGKVVETDASGKVHWECAVASPTYANRLPNGNTLVASVDGRYAVEVDRRGKEVWRKATKGRPFRARRY